MEKGGGKKWLVVTLVFLGVIIVGLAIGIIIVNLNRDIKSTDDEITHEELARGDFDVNYNIGRNISEIYYSDSKEKALDLYDREMKEALYNEYYERYVYLASNKANILMRDDRCEDALSFYDLIDPSDLPAEYEANIYIGAITVATTCEDDKHRNRYEEKLNKLIEEEDLGVEDDASE